MFMHVIMSVTLEAAVAINPYLHQTSCTAIEFSSYTVNQLSPICYSHMTWMSDSCLNTCLWKMVHKNFKNGSSFQTKKFSPVDWIFFER